jgi:filamentous hemagglutinin family protein
VNGAIGLSFIPINLVLAQSVTPDTTLGIEPSTVTRDVLIQGVLSDRIEGGATRGSNLFHSFSQFNVDTDRGVYFANPAGIENIFSRVTGNNSSEILGRLGVLGNANLFLLNPNGVVFGANASLDVIGSFTATTANAIQLGDRGLFSVSQPQESSLLSVAPGALLYNQITAQGGRLVNTGNLTAGQNLTLAANNLELQGQLQAGQDLTLQAQDTVQIRDMINIPFIASSGRNLLVHGGRSIDVFTLDNAQSKIRSGSNIKLLSNGEIAVDTRFLSGGNLSFLTQSVLLGEIPTNFTSRFGTTIYANGNILFGNYTGASLKVEALGNIKGENIQVTRMHCASGLICLAGLPENDLDFDILTREKAIILRSGSNAVGSSMSLLRSSSIDVKDVETLGRDGQNGGKIILNAFNGEIKTNNIYSYAGVGSTSILDFGSGGTGGDINLVAYNGNISINGNVNSSSSSFDTFDQLYSSGNGGNITLTTFNGDVVVTRSLSSGSASFSPVKRDRGGNGGDININTNTGNINVQAEINADSISSYQNGGNGGNITLAAKNGSIAARNIVNSRSILFASNVDSINDIKSGGNGGNIGLVSIGGNITVGDLNSFSLALSQEIFERNGPSLLDVGEVTSLIPSGKSGNGGNIAIIAKDGNISGSSSSILDAFGLKPVSFLSSFSISENSSSGNGGNMILQFRNTIDALEALTFSSSNISGEIIIQGLGDTLVDRSRILTSKQVKLKIQTGSTRIPDRDISLNIGKEGRSGNVIINSFGNLSFNNSSIQSDTKGSDPAGNVTVSSPGIIIFNDSQIISNTSSTGQAGSISVTAGESIDIAGTNSGLFAQTTNAGAAGNITLKAPQMTLQQDAQISTTATATSTNRDRGGSITLNASNLYLAGTVGVFAETQGQTPAGTLILNPYQNQPDLNITLTPSSKISASTSGSGNGGDLILTAPRSITISGPGQLAVETSGIGNAGNISVTAPQLTLSNGVELSASSSSQGKAGDIRITATAFDLLTGARVSSSTSDRGAAGNITVNASDRLTLTGTGSGFFASTDRNSTGSGGSITLNSGNLTLTESSQISAQSLGLGKAGDITITTNGLLNGNNSNIITEAQSSGGDIQIFAGDIRLRGDSDITTNVSNGTGGNITLTADSIIALDDSDILSFAQQGRGGNIALNTPAFFGQNYRPGSPAPWDSNDRVDINASGTVSGLITLPDVSFLQNGLNQLPSTQIDTNALLANSCIIRTKNKNNSFYITGSSSLPLRPGDTPVTPYPTGALQPIPSTVARSPDISSAARPVGKRWKKGDPIVEPQDIYQLPDGQFILSRECSSN